MSRKNVRSKLFAALMSIVLVMGLCPASALAIADGGGAGSPDASSAQGVDGTTLAVGSIAGEEGVDAGEGGEEPAFKLGDPLVLEGASGETPVVRSLMAQVLSAQADTSQSGITNNAKPTLRELRAAYASLPSHPSASQGIFAVNPDFDAYTPGVLKDESLAFAQAYINLIRRSANVDSITLDPALNNNAAYGALLLEYLNVFTHYPTVPAELSEAHNAEALAGKYACKSSNLSWSMGFSDPIKVAIQGQVDDSDESNMAAVGHRQWLLNPATSTMGIGSAKGSDGSMTTVIRVFNQTSDYDSSYGTVQTNGSTTYDYVAWPASGPFLNALFSVGTPWSVSFNAGKYTIPVTLTGSQTTCDVTVKLTRLSDGTTWTLDSNDNAVTTTGEYFTYTTNGYGQWITLVFNPGSANLGTSKYEGSYQVEITGLKSASTGESASLAYQVDFADPTASLSNGNATIAAIPDQVYTGGAIEPALTVTCEGDTLVAGEDYTVSYSNNTNAGEASVTITGKGVYSGTATATFQITGATMDDAVVTGLSQTTYNGQAQTPAPTVTLGGKTLASGTDYTVSYSNNTNAGEASVTITGKGVYSGTATATFQITGATMDDAVVTGLSQTTYNGQAQTPAPTVTLGGKTLASGTDYTVSYSNNTNAGEASVTIAGKGNYTGSIVSAFTIKRAPLLIKANDASKRFGETDPQLTARLVSLMGSDASKAPSLVSSENGVYTYVVTDLNGADVSFSVTRASGENVTGSLPLAITVANLSAGSGQNYEIETVSAGFTITKKALSQPDDASTPADGITITRNGAATMTYDGKAHEPAFTLKHGARTLAAGTDYVLGYSDNVDAGQGRATFAGVGNYEGTLVATFDIEPAPVTVTGITASVPYGQGAPAVLAVVEGVLGGDSVRYDVSLDPEGADAGVHAVVVAVEGNGVKGNQGNYTVTGVNGQITVTPRSIEDAAKPGEPAEGFTVGELPDVEYSGVAVTRDSDIVLKDGGRALVLGTDYELGYSNNTGVGQATVTITGIGNYAGSVTRAFEIAPASIAGATVTPAQATFVYDGTEKRPDVKVVLGSRELAAGTDYTVAYAGNVEAGRATATVTGTGNYTGEATCTFEIVDAAEPVIEQFAGATRFATARTIVEAALELGSYSGAIVVAGDGSKFPDALSAAGLSGVLDYPLVMVDGRGLTADSERALDALKAANGGRALDIVIVGGTAAVSGDVETALSEWGEVSERLGGTDRYETNALIYEYGQTHGAGWSTDTAFLATGRNFPDALAIAPYLVKSRSPIVLVDPSAKSMSDIPKKAQPAIAWARNVIALGGTAAVSDYILSAAVSSPAGGRSGRLAGENRYETAAAIMAWELEEGGMSLQGAGLATGENFPDALASGFLLGKSGSVLLLADKGNPLEVAVAAVELCEPEGVTHLRALGGDAAVPSTVRSQIASALGMDSPETVVRK